ncbi:hypothetical protein PPEP_b0420 [Pseudoalteromonas peptidolytica F12-50-A1]|uniref:Uncharacterized protein n=1 Tax=Pseudoalteromonas peptidolytica F12-50-A1 TaxID=1315280 RepID=A0A8I0N0C8_9GAMM|nr:hypothetical protein [Pseudoalteromonas peptidolytica F12-50-A1]
MKPINLIIQRISSSTQEALKQIAMMMLGMGKIGLGNKTF